MISTGPAGDPRHDAADAAVGVLQQADELRAGADLDVAGGQHGDRDGVHDRPAGLVALDPGHAGAAMSGLEALGEAAVGRTVERRAQVGQAPHGVRTLLGQEPRHRSGSTSPAPAATVSAA